MLRQTIAELIVLFFCYSVAGWHGSDIKVYTVSPFY